MDIVTAGLTILALVGVVVVYRLHQRLTATQNAMIALARKLDAERSES